MKIILILFFVAIANCSPATVDKSGDDCLSGLSTGCHCRSNAAILEISCSNDLGKINITIDSKRIKVNCFEAVNQDTCKLLPALVIGNVNDFDINCPQLNETSIKCITEKISGQINQFPDSAEGTDVVKRKLMVTQTQQVYYAHTGMLLIIVLLPFIAFVISCILSKRSKKAKYFSATKNYAEHNLLLEVPKMAPEILLSEEKVIFTV